MKIGFSKWTSRQYKIYISKSPSQQSFGAILKLQCIPWRTKMNIFTQYIIIRAIKNVCQILLKFNFWMIVNGSEKRLAELQPFLDFANLKQVKIKEIRKLFYWLGRTNVKLSFRISCCPVIRNFVYAIGYKLNLLSVQYASCLFLQPSFSSLKKHIFITMFYLFFIKFMPHYDWKS